jgi:hypothetical protein
MTTTARAEALHAGRNKYFTGKPCSKGHVAERYVQSSACVACVRLSAYASRSAATPATLEQRNIYADAVGSLRARVALRELDVIRGLAEAFLAGRFPALMDDARVSFRPPLRMTHKAGGTAIVRLPVHRDDEATMRAICDASLVALSTDNLAAVRRG